MNMLLAISFPREVLGSRHLFIVEQQKSSIFIMLTNFSSLTQAVIRFHDTNLYVRDDGVLKSLKHATDTIFTTSSKVDIGYHQRPYRIIDPYYHLLFYTCFERKSF